MHSVTTILLLLFIAALSGLLGRVIKVSLPLIQIVLGGLWALAGWHIGFDPDLFMLLFIPPLLFLDAYLTPMREFRELRGMILTMALGLVLFTTIGCGLFIHWLIPQAPLGLCFTLAAVLSPTDAVAVGGMVKGKRVPSRFVHIVQGEALLNDASGLVCFKFAAAATMTGIFSLSQALEDFFIIALGGLAVGVAIAWIMVVLDRALMRRGFDDPQVQVTLMVLLPFVVYLVADHFGLSGILAAVAAGVTVRISGLTNEGQAAMRLNSRVVWSMIGFLFNAAIFILLGSVLPGYLREGVALAHGAGVSPWRLVYIIAAVTGALIALRFVWIWFVYLLRAGRAKLKHTQAVLPSLRGATAMAIAGVRGAITLAAVLSLPVAAGDVAGFPHREFLVITAAGVIVLSLILANLTLPALLNGLGSGDLDPGAMEADRARAALAKRAILELEEQHAELVRVMSEGAESHEGHDAQRQRLEALARLLPEYQDRRNRLSDAGDDEESQLAKDAALRRDRQEAAIRLHITRVERNELRRMLRTREINDETDRLLQREIDMAEQALLATAKSLPHQRAAE